MKFVTIFSTVLLAAKSTLTTASNVVETALTRDDLTALVQAVSIADLVAPLAETNDITVFAPNNDAFEEIQPVVSYLATDDEYSIGLLKRLLSYHVLPEVARSTDLPGTEKNTLTGESLSFGTGSPLVINDDSDVLEADIEASNGVIHIIDKVLIPPSFPKGTVPVVAGLEGLSVLVDAVLTTESAGALSTAGQVMTVFAPTNEAFERLLEELGISKEVAFSDEVILESIKTILGAHVVSGSALDADAVSSRRVLRTLSGRVRVKQILGTLVKTNVEAYNGIIHVVDEVIVPNFCRRSLNRRLKFLKEQEEAQALASSIGGIAGSEDALSTLVAAVTRAGLAGVVTDPDVSLTVFAPVNDAFAAIGSVVEFLLVDNVYSTGLLEEVLLYHVLGSAKTAADLGTEEQTLLPGQSISINKTNDAVIINESSNVVTANIMASNGVVHVIDTVLVPPTLPLQTIYQVASGSVLGAIIDAFGLKDAFNVAGEGVYTVFAPTDAAFTSLLSALNTDLATVAGDPILKRLFTRVLQKHVVVGSALDSTAVLQRRVVRTAFGGLNLRANVVPILGSTIDVRTLNGIVHTINQVIVPRSLARLIKMRLRRIN